MNLKPINKEEIQGRARAFFRSNKWKNTLVFFSFIVMASCFWALQYFRQKFEFEVPIKIQYAHIPTGIDLSGNPPQEILLRVQDKGSSYVNYLIKQKKQTLFITIDLETMAFSKTSFLIDQAVLRELINEKIFASTQIISYYPDRIEINYSPLKQKELPVIINGSISPASGYLFSDSIRIEPVQVIVYGNESALDTLGSIQTLPLDYDDIDKNMTVSTGLQAPEGIRLSVNQVNLNITVEEYTERTFKLPVICYNAPVDRKVHFFPSMVELSVRVGLSKYSQLSISNFEIAVNYSDLAQKNTANCSLTLTRKPLWIESYRIAPDMIEFLIERKNE